MDEKTLLAAVLDLAKLFGWRSAHFRPALTAHGWRTAGSGDAKGFPDLLLCRPGRIVAVELKSDSGRLTKEQAVWLEALRAAGAEAYVWNPTSWRCGDIQAVLQQVKVAR